MNKKIKEQLLALTPSATARGFERKVKRFFLDRGFDAIDFTYFGKSVPDLLIIDEKGKSFFVECKNYRTYTNVSAGIKRWKKYQSKQYKFHKKLDKSGITTYLLMITQKDKIFEKVNLL